jgi:hypothetical protein
MPAAMKIPTIFTAVDRFSATVRKMEKNTRRFARKSVAALQRVNNAEKRLRKSMMKPLRGFGLLVGFALLTTVIGGTINKIKDFEQQNAVLASVMSDATRPELEMLNKQALTLGATTAKTATQVVELQEAFARLGFSANEISNMTEATISGSIAMRGELADTAELVGAVVNAFTDLSSINAPDIVDQMTLATQKSALNFEKLQTAIPIVGGAANAAGIPFTKLLALLGKLSDAGIDASMSSTALRNIFIESAKQGLSYEQILRKIENSQDKLTFANNEFGKRAAVSGIILSDNIDKINELDEVLQAASGTAENAANKQLDTLQGRLTLLGSAWEGFILSVDDGTGAFSGFLKTAVEVATEILNIASKTATAREELDKKGLRIRKLAERVIKFGKILKWFAAGILAVKAALFVANIVTKAWALGVKIATAVQWVWNAAMAANPIGVIILALAVLIPLIIQVVKHWDTWGQHVGTLAGGPIMWLVDAIKVIRDEWDAITKAFQEGGIIAGIKQIGKTIFKIILRPLEHIVRLMEKIGVLEAGTFAGMVQDVGLEDMYDEIGEKESMGGENEMAARELVSIKREERQISKSSKLRIMNETNNSAVLEGNDENISLTNTLGF